MSFDYASLVVVVQGLIKDFGRTITLQRLDGTAGNAAQPWRGPATPTVAFATSVPGVFVPASGAELGEEWLSAQLLASCSEVLLVAPDNVNDFTTINQIVDRTQTFGVQWVKALRPADIPLLYAMGVSR